VTRGSGVAAAPARPFARDAAVVTLCTLLSRLTGFVRVIVAAAALGTGVLGDTYQAANTVPNLLFELVAGGALQAVLLPAFVAARRRGGDDELGRTAGVVAGALTAALAVVAVLGVVAAPLLARLLTAAEDDRALAADKLDLMTPMLVVFVPQVVCYGIGMVATAALAARRRFVAAALAPAVNNVIVIVCYLLYAASRDSGPPTLDLTTWQFVLVAGGTTLAVVAFTAVPGIVLAAQGVRWRPRWSPGDPELRQLRRALGWAVLSVVGTLVPTAAAVVLGYDAAGGVAIFVVAFAFFVLPHALVAVPVATAMAPRVAETWQSRRPGVALASEPSDLRSLLDGAVRVVIPLLVLAGAAMASLSWPVARVAASFGDADLQGVAPIAHALALFGPGVVGYGMAFVMTRVLFAVEDVRRASILLTVAAVVGVTAMVLASVAFPERERAGALALGYGVSQTASAVLLTHRVRVLTGAPSGAQLTRLIVSSVIGGGAAGLVMLTVQQPFGESTAASLVAIAAAGALGVAVFLAASSLMGGFRIGDLAHRRAGGAGGGG